MWSFGIDTTMLSLLMIPVYFKLARAVVGLGHGNRDPHIFSGYGSGLRYIYFEDGGKDREYWAGQYEPALDAASVTIAVQVPEYNVFGLLALIGILAVVLSGTLRKRKKN